MFDIHMRARTYTLGALFCAAAVALTACAHTQQAAPADSVSPHQYGGHDGMRGGMHGGMRGRPHGDMMMSCLDLTRDQRREDPAHSRPVQAAGGFDAAGVEQRERQGQYLARRLPHDDDAGDERDSRGPHARSAADVRRPDGEDARAPAHARPQRRTVGQHQHAAAVGVTLRVSAAASAARRPQVDARAAVACVACRSARAARE